MYKSKLPSEDGLNLLEEEESSQSTETTKEVSSESEKRDPKSKGNEFNELLKK